MSRAEIFVLWLAGDHLGLTGPVDEVVDAVIEHGQGLHIMTATREAAIANARTPGDDAPGKRSTG